MDTLNLSRGQHLEEDDSFNDETFGDVEDSWTWEDQASGDGDEREPKTVSKPFKPISCEDLESDLNNMTVFDDPAIQSCSKLPPMVALAARIAPEEETINLEDFDFSDNVASGPKVKSVFFDDVWAPPDETLLKSRPSLGSIPNPWDNPSSEVLPPTSTANFFSSYPGAPSAALTLEDLEKSMLSPPEPPPPSLPPPLPLPQGKVKTLEEIEREMLEGPSSSQPPMKSPTPQIPAQTQGPPVTILQRMPGPHFPPPMMAPMMAGAPLMRPMFSAVAGAQMVRGQMIQRPPMYPMVHPSMLPLHFQRLELNARLQDQMMHQHHQQQVIRHQIEMQHRMMHPQMRHQLQQHQQHQMRQHHQNQGFRQEEERDEYAGLMSRKEQDWLIHIQKMQLDNLVQDPYVDDYYNMCYNSKKLNNKSTAALLILDRVSRDQNVRQSQDHRRNDLKEKPALASTPPSTNYTPFNTEGSLGKIQVSNAKCPRKLLDLISMKEDNVSQSSQAKKELTQLRKLLMDIERLYLILLKIDYEDKRMAALPESARAPHAETREALCESLFKGITENRGQKLNHKIASIRKGAALILRTLLVLKNIQQKKQIANAMVKEVKGFPEILVHKDHLPLLLDTIEVIKTFDPILALTLKSKIEETPIRRPSLT